MQQLIGIDLGGTKIEIAVINPSLGIVYKDRAPTPQKSYSDILNALHSLINKTISHQKLPHPKAIGIGMPGCLDPVTQLVRGSNTLVLNGQPLGKDLEQLLQCKVHLQNDANCLAVSEAVVAVLRSITKHGEAKTQLQVNGVITPYPGPVLMKSTLSLVGVVK